MAIQSYESYDMLLKQFLLPHPLVPYISMLVGMFACKLVWRGSLSLCLSCRFTNIYLWSIYCIKIVSFSSIPFFFLKVYDLNHLLSAAYFKSYSNLSKMQRIEWNNRWFFSLFLITCSFLFCFVHSLKPICFVFC